jgi:hypothetical protein
MVQKASAKKPATETVALRKTAVLIGKVCRVPLTRSTTTQSLLLGRRGWVSSHLNTQRTNQYVRITREYAIQELDGRQFYKDFKKYKK